MTIAPSLLNAPIAEVKELFEILKEKNVDYLHIDVLRIMIFEKNF